jgi:inner membrane transporter RhtA
VPLHAVPPSALVLTGIISVQLGAGLATRLFSQAAPAAVTGLRLWSAAALLGVFGARGLAGALRAMARRRAWPDLAVVVTFGLTLAIMNYSIYQSFARIPLGIAVTIEFLGPLAVAVAASRRPVDLLWVALAGAGVALLSQGGTSRAAGQAAPHGGTGLAISGIVFALVAAVAWAGYILLSAATGRRFSGSSGLVIAMGVAALAVTPTAVSAAHGSLARPGVLASGAAIGLLSSVIPYRFELEALRRIPAGVFGIWMSLEPAVAALVGLILLGQALSASEWAAVGCVMVACAGAAHRSAARAAARAESAASEPGQHAAGPDVTAAIPPPPAS